MPRPAPSEGVTVDAFLGGRLEVVQPLRRGHRAGLDAVLLAATVPCEATGCLVDLGAGVGVAGLAAALRAPRLTVKLVEIDTTTADLARRSVSRNPGLAPRVAVVETDATADAATHRAAGLVEGCAAHVILNPPFHPSDRTRPSPDAGRAAAHRADPADLDRWLATAARLCDPRGRLTLVHRADELPRVLAALTRRFGGIRVRPIQPRADAPAHRVLVAGRPQSRAPFALLAPLVLHGDDGAYTPQAAAVLAGGSLPFD